MKRILLPVFAASALLFGSCSTQQLAQQQSNDDVYFTEAKAKEVTFAVREEQKQERSYRTDEQLYGGGDYATDRYDDYDYDYGYASRINRFYGRSPWRSAYFDSWYAYSYYPWYTYRYDPFYYDPWYYRPGVSLWVGIGTYPRYGWYDNYYWGYYGSPYYSNYWGPYSYYNIYPGYGYGGGYYSGSIRRTSPNYRPRPDMGSGNPNAGYGTTRGSNGETVVIDRNTSRGPRPTTGTNNNRGTSSTPTTSSTREGSERARPTREESRPVYQAPSSRPSSGGSTSSSPSSGGGSSSGSSSGGSRGSRPTRGN